MQTVTTICVFLVMFGTIQTNAYLKQGIYNHGDNATVLIDKIPTDGKTSFEISFSGFTKELHDIHMFIIMPNTNNKSYIEVSRNYYGRIKDINMNNDNIRFLLLNVSFMDSGNYTVLEGSVKKGKGSILVTRRILNGQVSKPMILPFMCNNTNTSSIKIGKSRAFDYVDYIIYDVASKNCTYTNHWQHYRDSCVLNDTTFNLILEELTWSDKGAYFAWDDQELLLDALFLGIPDHITSSPPGTFTPDSSSHNGEHGIMLWPLVSSVVVVLVAAFLAIVTVRKLRRREVPKTTINNLTVSNGNPNTADISRNRHFEEATSPKASAMSLTKVNNADDPADFTSNKSHKKIKSNDKHYYARGLNSKSPTRTTNKLQIHSSVSSTEDFEFETTHGYNSTRKCAKLKTECRSDNPYLSSTKCIAGPSFEYDYVVQGTCMTSRAPDPFVTKQNKGRVITDDSISWYRKEDKTSSSRVDPSTSYAGVNKKRTKKTHCTDSSAEQGSRDLNIELPAPRSFKLESAASVDFKNRGVPQSLNYELARDVSDDSSALERESVM